MAHRHRPAELRASLLFWGAGGSLVIAWLAYHFGPVVACLGECYVDLESLHGSHLGEFESIDTRLNTWILDWVQHALTTANTPLFDANAFYPARGTLAGSEHLIGIALLTLPLRIFTHDAVWLYQASLIVTYAVLALTTMAAARWLVGSGAIAIGAGIVAMAMPWRLSELTHLQLLASGWIPLVWLLVLRIGMQDGRWREVALLSGVLSLQLLSSFYLAYQLTFSLAILAVTLLATGHLDRRHPGRFARLAFAALLSYGVLAISSLPYLGREARGELLTSLDPDYSTGLDRLVEAVRLLAPPLEGIGSRAESLHPTMFVPLVVLALAALAWGWGARPAGGAEQSDVLQRRRAATIALWATCLGAFVLSIGPELQIAGLVVPLPARLAEIWVPGYVNMRAPHRWGIVIGVAMPLLAALGARWVRERIPDRPLAAGLGSASAALVLIGALLAANVPWRQLAASPARLGPASDLALYAALSKLPAGPLLELPWHLNAVQRVPVDTLYMISSTRHHRPMLNGFTAYLPPSYFLLNRIAQGLPEPAAARSLQALTDLRYLVVHDRALSPEQRALWHGDGIRRPLRRLFANAEGSIWELAPGPEAGRWLDALRRGEPTQRTLTGRSRARLAAGDDVGEIEGFDPRGSFRFLGDEPILKPTTLRLRNAGSAIWPGLDIGSEGLVRLRYVFSSLDDQPIFQAVADLDADIPPGSASLSPVLKAPTLPGRYRLCLDLVQEIAGELHPLDARPRQFPVAVEGVRPRGAPSLDALAQAYRDRADEEGPSARSRCNPTPSPETRPGAPDRPGQARLP